MGSYYLRDREFPCQLMKFWKWIGGKVAHCEVSTLKMAKTGSANYVYFTTIKKLVVKS